MRLQKEEELELEHLLESKKLVKCLLCYARCNPSDHEVAPPTSAGGVGCRV